MWIVSCPLPVGRDKNKLLMLPEQDRGTTLTWISIEVFLLASCDIGVSCVVRYSWVTVRIVLHSAVLDILSHKIVISTEFFILGVQGCPHFR